jgi:hypothetical protein
VSGSIVSPILPPVSAMLAVIVAIAVLVVFPQMVVVAIFTVLIPLFSPSLVFIRIGPARSR